MQGVWRRTHRLWTSTPGHCVHMRMVNWPLNSFSIYWIAVERWKPPASVKWLLLAVGLSSLGQRHSCLSLCDHNFWVTIRVMIDVFSLCFDSRLPHLLLSNLLHCLKPSFRLLWPTAGPDFCIIFFSMMFISSFLFHYASSYQDRLKL